MSEALKELKTIYDIGLVELPQGRLNGFIRRINIIEKELKEHETLKTLHAKQVETINALLEEDKTKDKKLKALEIIKEMLDQYDGLDFEEVETGVYVSTRTEPQYGKNYFISKEKAKLLKKVLNEK